MVEAKLKDTVACEVCGSTDTKQTYENVSGYKQKIIVTHCDNCELSFYKEPAPQN